MKGIACLPCRILNYNHRNYREIFFRRNSLKRPRKLKTAWRPQPSIPLCDVREARTAARLDECPIVRRSRNAVSPDDVSRGLWQSQARMRAGIDECVARRPQTNRLINRHLAQLS